jgi:3-oxoisoapionate decarboxylase
MTMTRKTTTTRRQLLAAMFAAGLQGLGTTKAAPVSISVGVDIFSLRSQGWTPIQCLEFCAARQVKLVHFSEIRFLGSLDPENLKRVRGRAAELGLDLEIGMRSICPTATMFDPKQGTAEEQLTGMIDAARIIGSPIVRCVLGSSAERKGKLPLEAHIQNTVGVLKNVRSMAVDTGVKIAVENHAGDMQARELKILVESAGPEFVGVCLDSGNPLWTIEDPHLTLDTLAPYVLTSHFRDTRVWNTERGAAVAWCRMGQGNIGMEGYLRDYIQKCPGRPVSLESIVNGPRYFAYRSPDFWDAYRATPAWEFARFMTLVERGTPPPAQAAPTGGPETEREDLEASLRWTQQFLTNMAKA